jgi:hypothetical protein
MLFDVWIVYRLGQERMKDTMREVEQDRLIRLANSARPGLPDRVLASVGGLLISAGQKLQEREMPVKTGLTGSPSPCGPMTKPC